MALTTCRECSREVSTEAESCPHCGIMGPAKDWSPTRSGGTSAGTVAAGTFVGLAGCVVLPFVLGLVAMVSVLMLAMCAA